MIPDSDVWLADVLRSCEALRSSRISHAEILAAFGFELAEDTGDPTPGPTDDAEAPDGSPPVGAGSGTAGPPADESGQPARTEDRQWPALDRLEPVGRIEPLAAAGDRGTAVDVETPTHFERPKDLEPLLRPSWTFGVIYSAVTTPSPRGEIDVDILVDRLSRFRPIEELPRLPRESLHRGVQLLVDIGAGMQPFFRDQREFAATIVEVVGHESVELLRFRGCPTTSEGAGPGALGTWKRYELPDHLTPVVALTDLGIGGSPEQPRRDHQSAWIQLADELERRGSRITAFVPYTPDRYPPSIRSRIAVIPWDRSTDVSLVRQILRSTRR